MGKVTPIKRQDEGSHQLLSLVKMPMLMFVREHMEKNGISIKDVAELLGETEEAVEDYLHPFIDYDLKNIMRIAYAINVYFEVRMIDKIFYEELEDMKTMTDEELEQSRKNRMEEMKRSMGIIS
jgi:predicted transcriptional regulator